MGYDSQVRSVFIALQKRSKSSSKAPKKPRLFASLFATKWGEAVARCCGGLREDFYKKQVFICVPPIEGRIHALFLIPELVPMMIAAGFIEGQQVAQSLGRPKLARTLEAALLLPTG